MNKHTIIYELYALHYFFKHPVGLSVEDRLIIIKFHHLSCLLVLATHAGIIVKLREKTHLIYKVKIFRCVVCGPPYLMTQTY